jgi:hypothetical protein
LSMDSRTSFSSMRASLSAMYVCLSVSFLNKRWASHSLRRASVRRTHWKPPSFNKGFLHKPRCRFKETISTLYTKTPWPKSASELFWPSDRRFSEKLVKIFADRGCHVTDPHGRILGFLDRSRYFFIQVALQLYSWNWVDSISDPLFLRKSDSVENRTRTSGSVARNSDH